MAKIKQEAKGDAGIEAELKDGFWRLMGWSSSRTMDIYTHTLNKRSALLKIALEDQEDLGIGDVHENQLQSTAKDQTTAGTKNAPEAAISSSGEDDEFGWYEEE
jgi:hypothetical protein